MVAGYLDHLTADDLRLLAGVAGRDGTAVDAAGRLASDPERVHELMSEPALFDRLFGPRAAEPLLVASPFLAFAVLVHRAAVDLRAAAFVEERVPPGRRVPVFDVGELRSFVEDPLRRFFLAELLASYTRVAAGVVWTRTRRGWRKHRYSELDPVRFASLLDVVPDRERPGIYRRLGDLALFLTGVFPDGGPHDAPRPAGSRAAGPDRPGVACGALVARRRLRRTDGPRATRGAVVPARLRYVASAHRCPARRRCRCRAVPQRPAGPQLRDRPLPVPQPHPMVSGRLLLTRRARRNQPRAHRRTSRAAALVALTVHCFAGAYVAFMRQEIRA